MSSTRLCTIDEIEVNTAKRFDIDGHKIAVVRIGDDFYAIGDTCSHADYSLSEGEIYSDTKELECWKHGSTFSLETGVPSVPPATKAVPRYDVTVKGDEVWVEIS